MERSSKDGKKDEQKKEISEVVIEFANHDEQ
jgi:hypothetical protein